MGSSQADKAKTHDRIVKLAAAKFRESGIDGISVADLMKKAGLTHGGFYRHFASRDDLVAQAIEAALADSAARLGKEITRRPRAPLAALIDGYLSAAHRDVPAKGCAIVALASEIPRSNHRARAAYTRQVREHLRIIAALVAVKRGKAAQNLALLTFSALVGALALARAVDDDKLSHELMRAVRAALKSRVH